MGADFRHEQEEKRRRALTAAEGFRGILDVFHTVYADLTSFAQMQGRNFPVTERTLPDLYDLYRTAAERLDMGTETPVYLTFDHKLGAETVGTEGNCAIVVSSECLDRFSQDQLTAMFGHELAHIRWGHVCFLNVERLLDDLLSRLPLLGELASETIKTLMLEWRLDAEYTADRGAAIAAGNSEPAVGNLMSQMGGLVRLAPGLLEPAWQASGGLPDIARFSKAGQGVLQILSKEFELPFGSLRIGELKNWCASPDCRRDFAWIYYTELGKRQEGQKNDGAGGAARQEEQKRGGAGSAARREEQKSDGAGSAAWREEENMARLHQAARKNDPAALACLGRGYLQGKWGLPRNIPQGLAYMRRAALENDADGLWGLALCFGNGAGKYLKRDGDMARWLFTLAGERGRSAPEGWEDLGGRAAKHPPKLVERVIDWYGERCAENPASSLHFCLEEDGGGKAARPFGEMAYLRDYLWIPESDPVYVYEIVPESESREAVIALTAYGIYRNSGRALPWRISWENFLKGELTGEDTGDGIEIWLNNRRLAGNYRGGGQKCIAGMLIKIKNLWERSR